MGSPQRGRRCVVAPLQTSPPRHRRKWPMAFHTRRASPLRLRGSTTPHGGYSAVECRLRGCTGTLLAVDDYLSFCCRLGQAENAKIYRVIRFTTGIIMSRLSHLENPALPKMNQNGTMTNAPKTSIM